MRSLVFLLALFSLGTARAECLDDALEPNNSSDTASSLDAQLAEPSADLQSCDAVDWYSVTVPAYHDVSVRLDFVDNAADLDLELYLGAQGPLPVRSNSVANHREVTLGHMLDTIEQTLLIAVSNNSYTEVSTSYTLQVDLLTHDDSCGNGMEPNNTAQQAYAIDDAVPGVLAELQACAAVNWYSFEVPGAHDVAVSIDFMHAQADLDLAVYIAQANDEMILLGSSTGTTDSEQVVLGHMLDPYPQTVFVAVVNKSSPLANVAYDLQVEFPLPNPPNELLSQPSETPPPEQRSDGCQAFTAKPNNALLVLLLAGLARRRKQAKTSQQ